MEGVYTLPALRSALEPVLERNGVKRAVLFGSYAKGTAKEDSDIDLLVDSGLKGLRFVALMDEVIDAVGKDVDLFDVTHIEKGSPVDIEIKKTGITIYEK